MADLFETHPFPHVLYTVPNLFKLYERNHIDPTWKIWPSRPAFLGHSKSLESKSTRIDGQSMTSY